MSHFHQAMRVLNRNKVLLLQSVVSLLEHPYCKEMFFLLHNTIEPGYNDIGLCDTSSIAAYILWYQLIPYC